MFVVFADPSHLTVELPPELCKVIMSPISWSTFYSFNFVPSIMHRFQSLLLAINLKKMLLDDCVQNVTIPTMKVLCSTYVYTICGIYKILGRINSIMWPSKKKCNSTKLILKSLMTNSYWYWQVLCWLSVRVEYSILELTIIWIIFQHGCFTIFGWYRHCKTKPLSINIKPKTVYSII